MIIRDGMKGLEMSYLEKYMDEELFQIFDANIEDEIKSRGYEYGWHKKVQYAGDIYVFVNPAFPSLVKIGYADNVEKRLKQLNRNSGLPDPFHAYATYKVKKRLEDLKLHKLIDSLDSDLRHSKNKEFYEMTPEKAFEVLSAIAEINGDEDLLVFNPFNDEYVNSLGFVTTKNSVRTVVTDGVVPNGTYYMHRKIKRWSNRFVDATVVFQDGKWIVQPGSIICPLYGNGADTVERVKLQRQAVRIVDDVLQEPVELDSPSAAAGFCIGGPIDGWTNLCDNDGVAVGKYRCKK